MVQFAEKCCPVCGIAYCLPTAYDTAKRNGGGSWHCPNGHSLHYSESTTDKLRRERDRAVQEQARLAEAAKAQRERAEKAERLASGRLTRLRKVGERIHAGVCPHCSRTFEHLARHMRTKHPNATLVAEAENAA